MTRRKRDLGKLTGLLTVAAEAGQAITPTASLPVTALRAGQAQPRREFDQARIEQLAASIRERGIIQPLLVRPVEDGYEIVAGERRWRAAQLAGLTDVPVVVRDLSTLEARQLALIENLQREDLNTVDEVDAKLELVAATLKCTRDEARVRLMQLLREPHGDDHAAVEGLFDSLGETWTYFVKNKLRILNWPTDILEAVRGGLPFTLGAVIVGAPAEAHAALIDRARAGESREELRQAIQAMRSARSGLGQAQATRVARVLASARWLEKLREGDRKAVERWLTRMPAVLRQALDE